MKAVAATRAGDHGSAEVLIEKASQVRKDLHELGDAARMAAQEKMHDMRRGMKEYYDQGLAKAKQLEQGLEDQIRAHPIRSVAIAAGAGLVVGMLVARRR